MADLLPEGVNRPCKPSLRSAPSCEKAAPVSPLHARGTLAGKMMGDGRCSVVVPIAPASLQVPSAKGERAEGARPGERFDRLGSPGYSVLSLGPVYFFGGQS